jgi:EAL domain-containing protein (putative c-di-GMP-specific phosphodiesterase class I)
MRETMTPSRVGPLYQPIVDAKTGEIRGLEALLPHGAAIPLRRRVLREACHQVQRWREWFGIDLRLSVKLSIAELDQPDLPGALAEAGAEPGMLCVEVSDPQAPRGENLAALDALGVHLGGLATGTVPEGRPRPAAEIGALLDER